MRRQADDKAIHGPAEDKALRQPARDAGNGGQRTGLPAGRDHQASGRELPRAASSVNPHYDRRPR